MYLKAQTYPKYNSNVYDIQLKLNVIRNNTHGIWSYLKPDGMFGPQTQAAIKAFQIQKNITPASGIVGDTTLKFINEEYRRVPVLKANNPSITTLRRGTKVYSGAKSMKDVQGMELGRAICDALSIWNQAYDPAQSVVFFIGQGFIVLSEWTDRKLHVHIDFEQIKKDFNKPIGHRNGKWIRVNYKSKFRQFRKFNVSKILGNIGGTVSNVSTHLGLVGCVINTVDSAGKAMKGEFKLMDLGKLGFDYASTLIDYKLQSVNTIRISVGEAATQYGNAVVKWKIAEKIIGKSAARAAIVAVGSSVIVVGIQCASAFMAGCELGKWIENKWHIGETAVNFYWELFLGDIVEKFVEWNTNRIVCIKYPEDWTDAQIKEFHSKFK